MPLAAAASSSSRIAIQDATQAGVLEAVDQDHRDRRSARPSSGSTATGCRSSGTAMPPIDRRRRCRRCRSGPRCSRSRFRIAIGTISPKPEGDDRQVVAAQAQGRRPEHDPEEGRDRRADEQHRPERERRCRRTATRRRRRCTRRSRRTRRSRGRAGRTCRPRCSGRAPAGCRRRRLVKPSIQTLWPLKPLNGGSRTISGRSRGDEAHADQHARSSGGDPRSSDDPLRACRAPWRRPGAGTATGAHARSPSCWPNRPAGRKTRVMIRITKTAAWRPDEEAEVRRRSPRRSR